MSAYCGVSFKKEEVDGASLFINCIPQKTNTLVIFGGHKNTFDTAFKYFFNQNDHLKGEMKVLKLLSDFAIRNVETWGISEVFYEERIQHKETAILERIQQMFDLKFKADPVGDICLFWD